MDQEGVSMSVSLVVGLVLASRGCSADTDCRDGTRRAFGRLVGQT